MTVGELLQRLKGLPLDMEVLLDQTSEQEEAEPLWNVSLAFVAPPEGPGDQYEVTDQETWEGGPYPGDNCCMLWLYRIEVP